MWLELESEDNLRPQSLSVFVAFFLIQIIPFNLANNVLSKGVVSSYAVTFEAFSASEQCIISKTVHGVVNLGGSALVIVFSN